MRILESVLLFALLLPSCNEIKDDSGSSGVDHEDSEADGDADADGDSDGDADADGDTDGDSDSDSDSDPIGRFTLRDLQSGEPAAGVTMSLYATTETTDAKGQASFVVPREGAYEISASKAGYPDYEFNFSSYWGFSLSFALIDLETLDILGDIFDHPIDRSKSMLYVLVFGVDPKDSSLYSLPGSRVDVDLAYDFAVVQDPESDSNYSEGNTTIEGGGGTVTFGNVTPGVGTLSVTPPGGRSCVTFPGGPALTAIELEDGVSSFISFICS